MQHKGVTFTPLTADESTYLLNQAESFFRQKLPSSPLKSTLVEHGVQGVQDYIAHGKPSSYQRYTDELNAMSSAAKKGRDFLYYEPLPDKPRGIKHKLSSSILMQEQPLSAGRLFANELLRRRPGQSPPPPSSAPGSSSRPPQPPRGSSLIGPRV